MVRLTLMPINRAPSWSCATARMALPALVSWTIPVSAAAAGLRDHHDHDELVLDLDSADGDPPWLKTVSHCFWPDPFHSWPKFWKMKLSPTAVISGASLGACRSRR